MTHGSLFSGIGGFELAAEWCGFENVFSCEQNPFGQRVLKHYWPNADHHDNVKTFPASDYTGRIDILTGGFPCQPYSVAGKRLGKEDDRHLWPFMLEIIREIAPTFVVGENVRGLVNWSDGLVFEEVCADLEAAGYDVQPFILPAAGVGAPHRRDRVWFIAHRDNSGSGNAMRTDSERTEGVGERLKEFEFGTQSLDGVVADASSANGKPKIKRGGGKQGGDRDEIRRQFEAISSDRDAADADNQRPQRSKDGGVIESGGQKRNEQPARCVQSSWDEFPTQPPVCGGDDGLSRELDGITFSKWRAESIKAYGNAIVPQVAYQIFDTIKQMN